MEKPKDGMLTYEGEAPKMPKGVTWRDFFLSWIGLRKHAKPTDTMPPAEMVLDKKQIQTLKEQLTKKN